MSNGGIVVVAEHYNGELSDIALEMLACGRQLADATHKNLTCIVLTDKEESFKGLPLVAHRLLIVEDPILKTFNPEVHKAVLKHVLRDLSPRLVIMGNTCIGMDLAAPLSLDLGASVVSQCVLIQSEGEKLIFTSKVYGGKLLAKSEVWEGMVFGLLLPGSYSKEAGMRNGVPTVDVIALPGPLPDLRVKFKEYIEPQAEDVDLTKIPILVAAGRGVQSKDNVEMLEELAQVLGGAVCATRPVVDQGWLPRTRQVGRSGMIVKPRLYLALGISGAPEHIEGMKDSELIVAVNTDRDAPIFDVAHYGTTVDLSDLVPALTKKLKAAKGGS